MRPIDADKARSIFDIQTPKGASVSIELILEWIDNQPTITLPGQWIDVNDRLPLPEETVLVATQCKFKGHNILQTCLGFYEDGNVLECDSLYDWDEGTFTGEYYDEKTDQDRVPEGWFESVTYSERFCAIDDKVVAWMWTPEYFKETTND